MRTAIPWLMNVAYVAVGLLISPIIIYRILFARRYRRGWSARFGAVPKRFGERPALWIHAVSVGEVNAIRPLVRHLRQQLPFHELMISTTTDTGYDRALHLFGDDCVFFFPLDFSFTMARAFARLRPVMVILIELEVWPNLVLTARRHDTPVVVINGRLTQRSVRRYGLFGPLTRWLFRQIDLVMVQDRSYRQRFLALGVPAHQIAETGSLKWDSARIDPSDPQEIQHLARTVALDPSKPSIVAGSTANAIEEEAIIRAYQQLRAKHPDLQLVIAPRKPERFDQVARLIKSRGFRVVRRSQHSDGTEFARSGSMVSSPVVLLDTMGELRRFYELATVVIVGRTFVPFGGSDVMEIAALGKAIIIGPHVDNFTDAVAKLREHEAAVQVNSAERMAPEIDRLLSDATALSTLAGRARQVVQDEQGATERTVRQICDLLDLEYDATGTALAGPKLKQKVG